MGVIKLPLHAAMETAMLKNRLSLVFVLLRFCFAVDAASASNVGYRRIEIQNGVAGERFPVAIWYPTSAEPGVIEFGPYTMRVARAATPSDGKFGLVVISHGSGGDAFAHRDLGIALASAGYVVAAPMHPRDNFQDKSGVGSVSVWTGRPKQVSRVIDRVLEDTALGPYIQCERIGGVGHSSGGYTALALAGAKPSMNALVQHCRGIPEDARFCSFGGGAARQAGQNGGDIPDVHDRRVRAIVLLAPHAALFTDEALSNLAVPARIYGAELDDLTPVQFHAQRLAKVLAAKAEYVQIKGAGHFSFIASFPDALRNSAGEAGRDPKGFDRNAMHETMNPEIVAFFNRTL
jgi:predicted dienelactone hydrolase